MQRYICGSVGAQQIVNIFNVPFQSNKLVVSENACWFTQDTLPAKELLKTFLSPGNIFCFTGCQKNLSIIVEGEALLNDGSSIVIFKICLELLKSTTSYFEKLTGDFNVLQLRMGAS